MKKKNFLTKLKSIGTIFGCPIILTLSLKDGNLLLLGVRREEIYLSSQLDETDDSQESTDYVLDEPKTLSIKQRYIL